MTTSATPTILNAGPHAWAFEAFAQRMAQVLGVQVVSEPSDAFLLLAWDQPAPPPGRSFVPHLGVQVASDKRLVAEHFMREAVPAPESRLLDSWSAVEALVHAWPEDTWVLKYPTGSGGAGHRLLGHDPVEPRDWPRPFLLQRFVPMERPEVFRLFGVAGEIFGFNARRFPEGTPASPWVAHARGARYEVIRDVPAEAIEVTRRALAATELLTSFGCVDLVHDGQGWLALEVGTDGANGHVDRDLGDVGLERELDDRYARAFWDWAKRS